MCRFWFFIYYINFLLQMSLKSGKILNMKLSRLHWKTIWIAIFIIYHSESESVSYLLCLTLCATMDCSLPGSSAHGILQARILEWVALPFSRGSSWPRGPNPDLLHCRQILYCLSEQWSSNQKGWFFFLNGSFIEGNHKPLEYSHLTIK